MIALYIILGLCLCFALILSLRAKLFIKLDDGFTVRAGIGPVIRTLYPKEKKKRRKPRLSSFSYKKHQKRLERDRIKAEKEAAKKAKKKSKKKGKPEKIADKASETASKKKKTLAERITAIADLIRFILSEFPRLASYIRTDIRKAHITVGGKDAAQTAQLYGAVSGAVSVLTELLSAKTKLKPIRENAIAVNADFLSEKTSAALDISLQVSLFSAVRVGWHTLKWFIGSKIKQSANKITQ